jgi:hypothetical protein
MSAANIRLKTEGSIPQRDEISKIFLQGVILEVNVHSLKLSNWTIIAVER